MNIQKKVKVIEKNVFDDKSLSLLNKKFEIIFIDPPFKEKKLYFLLEKIQELKLLSKNGNIIPKKRVNRDKCNFATKQRMFGVFAIVEILRYRGI